MIDKLYKITLQGLHGTKPQYRECYVVADDPTSAYNLVREYLDDEKIGFTEDRGLKTIELLAEDTKYPDCKTKLFKRKFR